MIFKSQPKSQIFFSKWNKTLVLQCIFRLFKSVYSEVQMHIHMWPIFLLCRSHSVMYIVWTLSVSFTGFPYPKHTKESVLRLDTKKDTVLRPSFRLPFSLDFKLEYDYRCLIKENQFNFEYFFETRNWWLYYRTLVHE